MTGFLLPDRYTVRIINALTFGKQEIILLLQRIHHDFTGNSGTPELHPVMRGKSVLPELDCVQMSYGAQRQAGRRNIHTQILLHPAMPGARGRGVGIVSRQIIRQPDPPL